MDAAGIPELARLQSTAGNPGATVALHGSELLPVAADSVVGRNLFARRYFLAPRAFLAALTCTVLPAAALAQDAVPFPAPRVAPPVVTPGKTSADPPSDAIVLFNG